jgi:hypothetical protein
MENCPSNQDTSNIHEKQCRSNRSIFTVHVDRLQRGADVGTQEQRVRSCRPSVRADREGESMHMDKFSELLWLLE